MTETQMKFQVPDGFEIEILDSDALNPERQDPEWYRFDESNLVVARVKRGDQVASIEAVGEMRYERGEKVARYCDQLEDVGITDAASLAAAGMAGSEIEIWNNPWFQVWIDNERFSEPEFDLGCCVATAVEMIKQEEKI